MYSPMLTVKKKQISVQRAENVEYEGDCDTDRCWSSWNDPKRFLKRDWMNWRQVEELKLLKPQVYENQQKYLEKS